MNNKYKGLFLLLCLAFLIAFGIFTSLKMIMEQVQERQRKSCEEKIELFRIKMGKLESSSIEFHTLEEAEAQTFEGSLERIKRKLHICDSLNRSILQFKSKKACSGPELNRVLGSLYNLESFLRDELFYFYMALGEEYWYMVKKGSPNSKSYTCEKSIFQSKEKFDKQVNRYKDYRDILAFKYWEVDQMKKEVKGSSSIVDLARRRDELRIEEIEFHQFIIRQYEQVLACYQTLFTKNQGNIYRYR